MKTALCFIGTARAIDHTQENLKRNFIEPLGGCDIFFHIAENPCAPKIEKYFTIPAVKSLVIEKEPEYDLAKYKFRPNWPNPHGNAGSSHQVYIKMIMARNRCNLVLSRYEQENNICYDRVIFSRLDVKYFEPIVDTVENLDLDFLYVPDFHNTFGGVIDGFNDRFALGNRKQMEKYFSIPDSLDKYVASGNLVHAETLLKWHLDHNEINVRKIPVRFTRVRKNGDEIDLRLKNKNLNRRDS